MYWHFILSFTYFFSFIAFIQCYLNNRKNVEPQPKSVFSTIKELIPNIIYKLLWIFVLCKTMGKTYILQINVRNTNMQPNFNNVINGTLSPLAFMLELGGTWKVLILIGTAFIGICTLASFLLLPVFQSFDKEIENVQKDKRTSLHIAILSGLAFIVELCLPTYVYQVIVNFIRTLPATLILLIASSGIFGGFLLPDFIRKIKQWCQKSHSK